MTPEASFYLKIIKVPVRHQLTHSHPETKIASEIVKNRRAAASVKIAAGHVILETPLFRLEDA